MAYSGLLGFGLFGLLSFFGILILHSASPATYSTLVTAELLVGWGTGLLATAAVSELYLSSTRHSAERTPNLSLSFYEAHPRGSDEEGLAEWGYELLEEGVPRSPDWDALVLRIENVGPGTAADIWVAATSETKSSTNSAGPSKGKLPRPKRVARFLRMGDYLDVRWRTFTSDVPADPETVDRSHELLSDAIIVGCNDLEGTIGDVQVIGLSQESEDPGIWTILLPAESEALLWRLTKGASWSPMRRMGFGLARPWQRRDREA